MNTKFVTYNGGKDSYYSCDEPNVLIKGKRYEVIGARDLKFQTNYTLKGLIGFEFNSVWFDEVSEPPTYLAISHDIPVEGNRMRNFYRLEGTSFKNFKASSTVVSVEPLSSIIYKVHTKNTLYIVQVIK